MTYFQQLTQDQVREMSARIDDKLYRQLNMQVCDKVAYQVWDNVWNQIYDQARNRVKRQIW
jgi:hypothetical protein